IAGRVPAEQIWGAGLFTAFFWFILGTTGAINWVAKLATKPVVRGIMLGLGLSFVWQGVGMMKSAPVIAAVAVIWTLLLFAQERIPAMLALLAFGIAAAFILNPALAGELAKTSIHFKLPYVTVGRIDRESFLLGTAIFAIPQIPLTLGNAIIAVTAENNELFPNRKVSERKVCLTTGAMNLGSTIFGGVPQCHGAGGMAGHVKFGARTGGALVILGAIVTAVALFFSESVTLIFNLFPEPILGVILFYAGAELASIVKDIGADRRDVYVMVVTAGAALFNMGVAFVIGIFFSYFITKGWTRV
ncbi:MAG: sulfate transporter, partial [Euryarchaeota archaeon]|nr:sulfate transporter [Euryarchaeota archaeon]